MAGIDAGYPLRGQDKKTTLHLRKRRLGIRIDMTPMVDVAFLFADILHGKEIVS